ncbi:YhgE/Pip family protein [Heyndrickxia ginsengihumi]|uniref:YhgE/Pip family protein n=1 Tax=Heyndrickxia ginsengihumi TaxID=363870 RepID=UPI000AA5CF27|nr:YhgE/Pip family protein [Heyndrickxia ginsengihumi]
MNSLWLAEIKKIFQSRKKRIEVIAIMLIPILYAGMFIWSFWDPYGNLEKLPIAIVNEDKGATLNGKSIEIGNKLVHKLKDEENFNYHFVDKKQLIKT